MGSKSFMKQLPVKLTEDEVKQRGKDLAKAYQDIAETEGHKKEVMDDFKAKVSALESQAASMSRAISNGYEYREVEVYWSYFWDKGEKHLIRTDTSETVDTQRISDFERQDRLTLEAEA